MARARNIKPGFFKNEDLAECSPFARLCFAGLWTMADREGRLEDRPKRIKGELFAYDNVEVDPLLAELEKWGFIRRYQVAGQSYIHILKFVEHQAPHGTEKDGQIPDEYGNLTVHERGRNGYITGAFRLEPYGLTVRATDRAAASDSGLTVKGGVLEGGQNTLIPDSGFLIPDSNTPLPPKGGGSSKTSKREFPLCPHSGIAELYHAALPELPSARLMSDKRKRAIRGFWEWVLSSTKSDGSRRAETVEEALAWIGSYFERVRLNDFLMGRSGRGAGHEGWECDLDFLLTDRGKKHVIEKTKEAA